jgi:DNA-binding MarR family transcriptional regulator
VDGGLVDKGADPSDGRSSVVTLSATGRALLTRVRRERSELLTRRIGQLDPQQRDTLQAAVPILELLLTEPEK